MKYLIKEYASSFRWLHWVIAFIVIPLLAFSFFLEDLPDTVRSTAIMMHKSLGITILFLTLLRLVWVIRTGRPPLPETMPVWEIMLARTVQALLYMGLLLMALLGWSMSVLSNHIPIYFGWFSLPIPGLTPDPELAELLFKAHQITAWVLIALIILHVIGAVKHAVIDRDKVMESMLP